MGQLVPLPNGQSATLRAPEDVSERLRRPIVRAIRGVRPEIQAQSRAAAELEDVPDPQKPGSMVPGPEKQVALAQLQYEMTNAEADAYQDATDYAAVALVERWTFEAPVTLDGLLDLPARTLDALRLVVAPLVNDLFVDTGADPNPTAPSGGSNGSATLSSEGRLATSLTSGEPSGSSVSG